MRKTYKDATKTREGEGSDMMPRLLVSIHWYNMLAEPSKMYWRDKHQSKLARTWQKVCKELVALGCKKEDCLGKWFSGVDQSLLC